MSQTNVQTVEDHGAKERLLQAAVGLFAENGYTATSVREIVSRAGVTKPVLYYYFGSKDGLYLSIMEAAAEEQNSVMLDILSYEGTLIDRMVNLYNQVLTKVRQKRNLVRVIYAYVFGPRKGAPECNIQDMRQTMVETISTICLEGRARDEVADHDLDTVAQVLMSLLDSLIQFELAHPGLSNSDLPSNMLHLIFQGLSPRNTEK